MKYKEFIAWCNARAADGCWSLNTAIVCSQIMDRINKLPFWKREKEWQKMREEVERDIVDVIEKKDKRGVRINEY